ncbi:hypothetical protein B0A48_17634 [Cryoendolithus antarcticus]|uniref:DUF4267 domain-containing protein n=1 Tax=Cryoendolithus antarcticus TaxID=1507870 RepID=A0A1V8SB72_9PEZI|nr:hypothetical protein B0A48_17634 [Cryoendolithus antarcticus]
MATLGSSRNIWSTLPPPAECLAILVGLAEVSIFGLAGLANTTEFAKGYGLPLPAARPESTADLKDEKDANTQRALVAAIAARNIEKGIIILAFATYWRDRRALGTVFATGLVTTVADLMLVRWYGVKEAVFGHVIGVFNCAAIGGALLYWGRSDPLW